jgi:acetyl esterase
MPIDPGFQTLLDQLTPTLQSFDIRALEPTQLRQMMKLTAMADGPLEDVGLIEALVIPSDAGGIPARRYRPSHDATSPPGIFVWYHGGGFTIGDLDTADSTCRKLANRSGAVVVSVNYRLAPEHPAPAAVDDAWTALQWVASHAGQLGGDASRLAIGGDSAGGTISAVVAVLARDAGLLLRHQLLVYPATDLTASYPSHEENAFGFMLTNDMVGWFYGKYLGPNGDPKDPRISPLFTDDLAGVAPAHVLVAEYDPLRDEGIAYAERLRDADVPVELHRYDGMLHGFFQMAAVTPVADTAVTEAAEKLRAALDSA